MIGTGDENRRDLLELRHREPRRREVLHGVRDAVRAALPELRGGQPAGRQVLLRVRHADGRRPRAAQRAVPPRSRPHGTAAGPIAERRLVSVLFADLVGFTSFSEGRDAEEVRELQSRYFETVREIIGRYGGTIEKFIGDAVMALWGARSPARTTPNERSARPSTWSMRCAALARGSRSGPGS